MVCKCVPTYCVKYDSIINYCPECESVGGSYGNVNHNITCKYHECVHLVTTNKLKNIDSRYCDIKHLFYKNKHVQLNHEFKKNLKHDIDEYKKIKYIQLLENVENIIAYKTNKFIPVKQILGLKIKN
jgi:hypothetical protein